LALALAFPAPNARAAGGGGGGGGGGNDDDAGRQTKQDMTTCPKGQVWDTKAHKCLRMHSEVLPDAQLVEYAYALAKAERYDEALQTLDMLKDPNTARALNYRGYATRKLGRTEEGVGYYLKSVAMDPDYAQVREYLGEAYVLQGKLDMARAQLETIAKICGSKDCEEYEDLADAIAHPGGA
jgi:tetratricopeptide (TPR) repeat protein